jgi:hypothetical protein
MSHALKPIRRPLTSRIDLNLYLKSPTINVISARKSYMKREIALLSSTCSNGLKWIIGGAAGVIVATTTLAQGHLNLGPDNDYFAARAVLSGSLVYFPCLLEGATSEPGEPNVSGLSSGQSAWWTWTAPSNGSASVYWTTTQYGFHPLVTVYTGESLNGLSLVASNNYVACYGSTNCGCHWRVRDSVTFRVVAGQNYQIAADSPIMTDAYWSWSATTPVMTNYVFPGGNIGMTLFFSAPPSNDDFELRTTLNGSRTQVYADNFGAGRQVGEPNNLSNPGGSSVWYSWTAPASGRVTISANEIPPYNPPWAGDNTLLTPLYPILRCGRLVDANPLPVFFPVFTVYTGSSLDSLISANALPMELDAYPHGVEFDAVGGQTYQIALDGNMGTMGFTPVYLALTKPAINDSFARRIRLRSAYALAQGYNAGATQELGEPATTNSVGKTVWWSWKAPLSGPVTIDLSGSDYAFPVAVYTGATLARLRQVATGEGAVTFNATAGKIYQIAVSDSAGLTGLIKMSLRAPIVEAHLMQVLASGKIAVLTYWASAGQIVLLQYSNNGESWENLTTATAHSNSATFLVCQAPTAKGPFYRALVIDRAF